MAPRQLDNWLKAYMVYSAESESPDEYHLWTAISCIAAVLQRRVFFDMGYFPLYPNLYIVLVGPAGRCKKSTAMRMGKSIFAEIPGVEFSADSTTRERFIQDLSMAHKDGMSALTVHSTEFASLLTSSGMDMVVFLTDIFDCPPEWSHKTKASGTNKIMGPYLNLLGATTPDWIAKAMPLDTIGIGLTSRIIFVYQDTPRVRDPFPTLSQSQRDIHALLVQDLAQMAVISGQYQLTDEAQSAYRDWYKTRVESTNPTGDNRLAGYYERKPMHLLKLCMIIAASFRDEMIIQLSDFIAAQDLFTKVEDKMQKVFSNVGKNPLAVDMEDIATAISATKDTGLSVADLLGRFKHSVRMDELSEVLMTLQQMGLVQYVNGRYISQAHLIK